MPFCTTIVDTVLSDKRQLCIRRSDLRRDLGTPDEPYALPDDLDIADEPYSSTARAVVSLPTARQIVRTSTSPHRRALIRHINQIEKEAKETVIFQRVFCAGDKTRYLSMVYNQAGVLIQVSEHTPRIAELLHDVSGSRGVRVGQNRGMADIVLDVLYLPKTGYEAIKKRAAAEFGQTTG